MLELIKWKVFEMSPAPNQLHQQFTGKMHTTLDVFPVKHPCDVYTAPFDVRFPSNLKDDKELLTVLQPEVCIVFDSDTLLDRGCIGAPDIVVEVLSPGGNSKELKKKFAFYEESGVKNTRL